MAGWELEMSKKGRHGSAGAVERRRPATRRPSRTKVCNNLWEGAVQLAQQSHKCPKGVIFVGKMIVPMTICQFCQGVVHWAAPQCTGAHQGDHCQIQNAYWANCNPPVQTGVHRWAPGQGCRKNATLMDNTGNIAPVCTRLHQVAPGCTGVHRCKPMHINANQCKPVCTGAHW